MEPVSPLFESTSPTSVEYADESDTFVVFAVLICFCVILFVAFRYASSFASYYVVLKVFICASIRNDYCYLK